MLSPVIFFSTAASAAKYLPPEHARIFSLINQAHDCMAILETYTGGFLPEKAKTEIIERITPLAQALNLTFKYETNPFVPSITCDFARKHATEVEVQFCGQRPSLMFHGTLHFQYLLQLFNSSEIKDILEQATTRDCGYDTMQVLFLTMITALMLALLIAACYCVKIVGAACYSGCSGSMQHGLLSRRPLVSTAPTHNEPTLLNTPLIETPRETLEISANPS